MSKPDLSRFTELLKDPRYKRAELLALVPILVKALEDDQALVPDALLSLMKEALTMMGVAPLQAPETSAAAIKRYYEQHPVPKALLTSIFG